MGHRDPTDLSPLSYAELESLVGSKRRLKRLPRIALRLLATIKDRESEESDFLAFIHGHLAAWPCACGSKDHAGTPPMNWPEWVAGIVAQAKKDAVAEAAANGR